MRRLVVLVAAALAIFATHAAANPNAELTVYAASSLTDVFPKIDPHARFQFGGSNTLAAQIVQGAPADVFASASTRLAKQLFSQGLCSKPVVFARNALVVVVPKSNPANILSVYDLRRSGVKLVIAGPGVPVGTYTLQILEKLNLSGAVLQNVVSRETDVRDVLAKVALGEADAGFVYSTDAKAVSGKVRVITIPRSAEPTVEYGICAVSKSNGAARFIHNVMSKRGQALLVRFGFLPRKQK